MNQVLISQEKNYLVLRIPIKAVKSEDLLISASERNSVNQGLRDFEKGRHSRTFDNAKEAVKFLRSL